MDESGKYMGRNVAERNDALQTPSTQNMAAGLASQSFPPVQSGGSGTVSGRNNQTGNPQQGSLLSRRFEGKKKLPKFDIKKVTEVDPQTKLDDISHLLSWKELLQIRDDSDDKEFLGIPCNHTTDLYIPGLDVTKKNRHHDNYPNPETKVTLQTSSTNPCDTYINANFIEGYGGESKAFIATQGPMPDTIADFWNMAFYWNCPVIVMLTEIEGRLQNKRKCEYYWPREVGQEDIYGEIKVCIKFIKELTAYTVMNLTLRSLNTGESKNCTHYWFKDWPDHGAPESAIELLELIHQVEKRRHTDSSDVIGPTIVHCSAGVGRTGAFIAISIGMLQLMETGYADVLRIICHMRKQRGGLVLNVEQFGFIYKALQRYINIYMKDGKIFPVTNSGEQRRRSRDRLGKRPIQPNTSSKEVRVRSS